MKKLQKELYESDKRLCLAEAEAKYNLIIFGDHLATREGYTQHKGIDALHFYLVEKHHWLPAQVRSLSDTDLLFLFAEEKKSWTVPAGLHF